MEVRICDSRLHYFHIECIQEDLIIILILGLNF